MKNFLSIIIISALFYAMPVGSAFAEDASKTTISSASTSAPSTDEQVRDWFSQYDQVRKNAKMTFKEKLQSKRLIAFAFSPFRVPVSESDQLVKKMATKYAEALESLEKLAIVQQTERLRAGYMKYFRDARQLFLDTCKIPTGDSEQRQKFVDDLVARKKKLEELDQKNKALDSELRSQFSIPPLH
jgi:hypothetical protein